MTRFINEDDYLGYIKADIKKQITGTTTNTPSTAQVRAEDTAIATIKQYIGGRYDCNAIFSLAQDVDDRNLHIVACVIKLALYDLYHQTGVKDLPEHRKVDYDDTIQWLKDVGRGTISTQLPVLADDSGTSEIWGSSRPLRNHKW